MAIYIYISGGKLEEDEGLGASLPVYFQIFRGLDKNTKQSQMAALQDSMGVTLCVVYGDNCNKSDISPKQRLL